MSKESDVNVPQNFDEQNLQQEQQVQQQEDKKEEGGIFSYFKKNPIRLLFVVILLAVLVFGALYMFKPSLVQGLFKFDKGVDVPVSSSS